MIRFDPGVRIAYMSWPLAELFAAAAWWSGRFGIDLVFFAIEDPIPSSPPRHGMSLAADFSTEGAAAEDLAQLHAWLLGVLPAPWTVSLAADRVSVEWEVGE